MALTEVNTQGIKNASIKLEDIENGTSSDNGKFLKNNDGAAPSWTTVSTDLLSDTIHQSQKRIEYLTTPKLITSHT